MEGFLSVKYAAWKSIPFPSRPSISDFTLAQEIRMYPGISFQQTIQSRYHVLQELCDFCGFALVLPLIETI